VDIGSVNYATDANWVLAVAPPVIPLAVQAYIEDSEITADGKVDITADSKATINSIVEAASVAVAASAKKAGALTAAGVYAENRIATAVRSFISYTDAYSGDAEVIVNNGDLTITAKDDSSIEARALAASLAASFSGEKAGALSVGLSLAFNTIDNEVLAAIENAALVDVNGGITISATADAAIKVTSAAASVAVAGASGTAAGLSGGGAVAQNVILTDVNAFVDGSVLGDATTGNTLTFVDIDASNTSTIEATILAAAAGIGISGEKGIGAAIGVSVARNFIGWDPSSSDFDTSDPGNYTTEDDLQTLTTGNKVKVIGGVLNGEVYEYIGDDVTRFDHVAGSGATASKGDLVYAPSTGGIYEYNGSSSISVDQTDSVFEDGTGDWIYRGANEIDFSDRLNWTQVLDESRALAADVQAYVKDSDVVATGVMTLDANGNETIKSLAITGTAAIGGGGTTGVGVSVAGVYTENRVRTFVKAFIDGSGDDGITAESLAITAYDTASIRSDAGAASIAGGFGGTTGVGVSIGLAVAINEVANEVEAFISNGGKVETASGDITLDAQVLPGGIDPEDYDTSDGQTSLSIGDRVRVLTGHDHGGKEERIYEYRGAVADYDISDGADFDGDGTDGGSSEEREDDSVLLHTGNTVDNGTTVYRYLGDQDSLYLGAGGTNFADASLWEVVDLDSRNLALEDYSDSKLWELADATIGARAGAASIGLSFGGTTGVAVSGAGAIALNKVLTQTNAYIAGSEVISAGNIDLDAQADSTITALVAAASVAVGGGGTTGVGASIGISYAQNHIGWDDGVATPAEVRAFISESKITGNDLTLDANNLALIDTVVLAGSVAVGAGGTAGVGVSGAGVISLNKIATDVQTFIDGDDDDPSTLDVNGGVLVNDISLVAVDNAQIDAVAGAASVAAGFAGTAGVAVSIGVAIAHNEISNNIASYIEDESIGSAADPVGNVTISATNNASIYAVSAAASVAIGGGGVAGVGVSGAGAVAENVILTRTNAYIQDSTLFSSGFVDIDAMSTSTINAVIVAATAAVGAGGAAGVGASVGVAIARNFIGWNPRTTPSTIHSPVITPATTIFVC
jgi:hypothetical protein